MATIASKKFLPWAVLVLGLSMGFLALLTPSTGLAVIAIALIMVGLLTMAVIRRKGMSVTSMMPLYLLIFSFVFLSSGCAVNVKVPMAPQVPNLEVKEPIAIDAALLIPEKTKNYVYTGKPESFTGGGRPHEFPLGEALETASIKTFSQVFKKVTLVRTLAENKNYKAVIEPEIKEFHFEYDQLSYAGFAIAVLSKITVKVTLTSGETKVYEKILESPQQKKGPWAFKTDYEFLTGESASDALVYTLKEIALEMSKDPAVQRLASPQ
jgi:hypothetical protein